ncbi:MAG TPA: hypothetical protein VGI93_20095 [Steroidobacteraceae bacterium]
MPQSVRHYCLLLLLCLAHASADTAGIQHFVLPGHGTLDLSVPSSWRAQVHQPANPLPPTVTLAPTAGEPFRVLITAVWPLPPNTQLANLAEIREQVAGAAHDASPQSVEKVLPLEELKGTENRGYFFRATDQAPKAGEFKYLTQGIIRVGGVNVAFTVLTNDGQESVVAAALDTLRTAGQHPED